LHNWLFPRDEQETQNLCQSVVKVRLGKYMKYNTIFSSDSPTEVIFGRIFKHNNSNYAQSRKEVPFGGLPMADHIYNVKFPKTRHK